MLMSAKYISSDFMTVWSNTLFIAVTVSPVDTGALFLQAFERGPTCCAVHAEVRELRPQRGTQLFLPAEGNRGPQQVWSLPKIFTDVLGK